MNLMAFARTLNPFMDEVGDVFIEVYRPDSIVAEHLRLNTAIARSVIKAMLCSHVDRGFPNDQETKTALDVITGYAFMQPRREATLSGEWELQQNPLARAVLAVARAGGEKKPPAELLGLLTRTAEREGIELGPNWPTIEDALGKQLARLVTALATKGVELTRHEKERPRTWSIRSAATPCDARDGEVSDASDVIPISFTSSDTSTPESPCEFESTMTDDDILAQLNGAHQ